MFEKDYFEFEAKVRNGYTFAAMRRVLARYVDWILSLNIPVSAKILDLGCSFGYFLNLCDEQGFETYGLDISRYAIKRAKMNTKSQVFLGDISRGVPFKNDRFDIITMFDTIEHLDNPRETLQEVHRVLKKKGLLVITTPNAKALGRIFRGNKWYGFEDKTHLSVFTPMGLSTMLSELGFEIVKIETPFHPLPPFLSDIAKKTMLGGLLWLVGKKTSLTTRETI
jgi:SAM-dependent methyltransferase